MYSGIFFSDFKLQLNYFIDLYFGDLIAQDLFSFLRNYLEMLFILEIFFWKISYLMIIWLAYFLWSFFLWDWFF